MAREEIAIGVEYLGGIPQPTTDDVGKLVNVALDEYGDPTYHYVAATDAIVADDTLATSLAPTLRGVGLTVDSNGNLQPRRRPRKMVLQDHFVSGSLASGAIGQLGWNLLGLGTPAIARVGNLSLNSPSRLVLSTSSLANDRTVLCLGSGEALGVGTAAEMDLLQASWNFNSSLATKRVFFGMLTNMGVAPSASTHGIGIYYDSAVSPNYQLIARAFGAGSPINTGVAVPANIDQLISIHRVGSAYSFYAGNTALGSITSGVPTAALNVGFRVETLAASSASVRLGYFGCESSTLAGCLDDDTFLEV